MKDRVVLVRLGAEELRHVVGGIMVKLEVTSAGVRVDVDDDAGNRVVYRKAELAGAS